MHRIIAFGLLAALLQAYQHARAEPAFYTETPTTWLNTGGISLHERPGFHGINPGLGIELRWSADLAGTAGVLINSEGRQSRYLAAIYTPWHPTLPALGTVHVGAMAGAVDGYSLNQGRPLPLLSAVVDKRWPGVAVGAVITPRYPQTGSASIGFIVRWRF